MPTVLLTGGTGVLGSALVPRLADAGHTVRIMSRRPATAQLQPGTEWAEADVLTGEGLASAVAGVDAIIHAASNPRKQMRETEVEGTRHLAEAARAAGSPHLLSVSIVGIDRIPFPYYKAKLAAEKVVEDSDLPWSILRATQFHTLLDMGLRMFVRFPVVPLPKDFRFQPIDPGEVAERIVQHIAAGPGGRLPDLGGPEVRRAGDLAKSWLRARGKRALLVHLPLPGAIARGFRRGYNCTPEHAGGKITWEEWLERRYRAKESPT